MARQCRTQSVYCPLLLFSSILPPRLSVFAFPSTPTFSEHPCEETADADVPYNVDALAFDRCIRRTMSHHADPPVEQRLSQRPRKRAPDKLLNQGICDAFAYMVLVVVFIVCLGPDISDTVIFEVEDFPIRLRLRQVNHGILRKRC